LEPSRSSSDDGGNRIPAFLLERRSPHPPGRTNEAVSIPFLERGIHRFSRIVRNGYAHWESSNREGVLQRVDARIKVLFLSFWIVLVSLKHAIPPQAGISAFVFLLYCLSRLEVRRIYGRVLVIGLVFGVLIPFFSLFNLFSGGVPILPVIRLPWQPALWGHRLPEVIGVTREGAHGVAILFLRITNSVALSFLLLHTTPFPDIVRALRVFRVPDVFVVIITLSYKYLFLFSRTVEDMHLAKRSRLLGAPPGREARRWMAERLAILYRKSQLRCEGIFQAMVARGFSSDVRLGGFRPLNASDWCAASVLFGAGALFLAW
jgi:cobalt ECF transporter T component CbiQ